MNAMNSYASDVDLFDTPNIKYVVDHNARGWICQYPVDQDADLLGQGCYQAEEWIYDRNFGG